MIVCIALAIIVLTTKSKFLSKLWCVIGKIGEQLNDKCAEFSGILNEID